MRSSIASIAGQFELNTRLALHAIDEVSDDDRCTRPMNKGNSMHWVFGHAAATRFLAARLLGGDEACPWGDLFDRGAQVKDQSAYPGIEEIKTVWKDISPKMAQLLENVSDEALSAKSPIEFPCSDSSIRGAISFLSLHESYHVGQLAYIRRLLDYDQLNG